MTGIGAMGAGGRGSVAEEPSVMDDTAPTGGETGDGGVAGGATVCGRAGRTAGAEGAVGAGTVGDAGCGAVAGAVAVCARTLVFCTARQNARQQKSAPRGARWKRENMRITRLK